MTPTSSPGAAGMEELIARLEKATRPDRGLDGRIAWALGWRFSGFDGSGPDETPYWDQWEDFGGGWKQSGDAEYWADVELRSKAEARAGEKAERWPAPPCWTASIDAALALVERMLPGCWQNILHAAMIDGDPMDWHPPPDTPLRKVPANICLALLRALRGSP